MHRRYQMASIWDAPGREALRDARPPLHVIILGLLLINALVNRIRNNATYYFQVTTGQAPPPSSPAPAF